MADSTDINSTSNKPPAPRRLQQIFLGLFFLLLCLPLVQLFLHPFPRAELKGIAIPARPARPVLKTLLDESFQKAFAHWFMRRNGLWEFLVRASNQVYYSVFGQVSGSFNPSVLAGNSGYFFQPMYLKAFNRTKAPDPRALLSALKRVKKLQDFLAQRNIPLILLISPNIVALYPELLPSQYVDPTRLQRQSSYDILRPRLDELQLNYIDSFELFSQLKPRSPIMFFEPGGSHWNDVASCMATNLMLSKIEALSGRNLIHFTCEPWTYRYPPAAPELDLLDIANLLLPEATWRAAPYPEARNIANGGEIKPNILLVGSSFLFAIQQHLERQQIAASSPLYFYFRQVRNRSDESLRLLRREAIDWERNILSYDAIVLEINQTSIGAAGYGFVEHALKHFVPKAGSTPVTLKAAPKPRATAQQ